MSLRYQPISSAHSGFLDPLSLRRHTIRQYALAVAEPLYGRNRLNLLIDRIDWISALTLNFSNRVFTHDFSYLSLSLKFFY